MPVQTKIRLHFFLCHSDLGQGSRLPEGLLSLHGAVTPNTAPRCAQGASDVNVHPQKVEAGSREANLPFLRGQQGRVSSQLIVDAESATGPSALLPPLLHQPVTRQRVFAKCRNQPLRNCVLFCKFILTTDLAAEVVPDWAKPQLSIPRSPTHTVLVWQSPGAVKSNLNISLLPWLTTMAIYDFLAVTVFLFTIFLLFPLKMFALFI